MVQRLPVECESNDAQNPVRDDALTPARLYCRGLLAGYARASLQIDTTLAAEARALVAMEHLGFTAESRWELMDYARMMAELELGHDVDPYTLRHFAAEVVLSTLRIAVRRKMRAA